MASQQDELAQRQTTQALAMNAEQHVGLLGQSFLDIRSRNTVLARRKMKHREKVADMLDWRRLGECLAQAGVSHLPRAVNRSVADRTSSSR